MISAAPMTRGMVIRMLLSIAVAGSEMALMFSTSSAAIATGMMISVNARMPEQPGETRAARRVREAGVDQAAIEFDRFHRRFDHAPHDGGEHEADEEDQRRADDGRQIGQEAARPCRSAARRPR